MITSSFARYSAVRPRGKAWLAAADKCGDETQRLRQIGIVSQLEYRQYDHMLNRLLLMRHAKSSWTDGKMSDHDRPLNARGQRAATAMGAALTARGYAPDIIWSSDSKRTRETAMRLIRAIPGAQTVNYNPEFYHASVETVLRICGQEIEPDSPLMLLGHNPGWAGLHHYFTGQHHDYPTGACTVLTRKTNEVSDWLDPAAWQFKDLILPRDLEA